MNQVSDCFAPPCKALSTSGISQVLEYSVEHLSRTKARFAQKLVLKACRVSCFGKPKVIFVSEVVVKLVNYFHGSKNCIKSTFW